MNEPETYQRLLGCLRAGLERPAPDLPISNLALDSLDTVEFLCAVHAEFGVRLTEAQFHPQQTLAGLAQFLHALATAQPAQP